MKRGDRKSMTIYTRPDHHKELKRIALEKDTSLQNLVDGIFEEYIDRERGKDRDEDDSP